MYHVLSKNASTFLIISVRTGGLWKFHTMTGTDKSCMGKSLACSVWLCVRIHIMAGMDLYYMQIPRFCRAVCHGHMIRIHLYYIQISRFCHVLRHGHMIRIHLYYIQIPRYAGVSVWAQLSVYRRRPQRTSRCLQESNPSCGQIRIWTITVAAYTESAVYI